MTPRERVLCLLGGEKPDRVPWFGDLDYLATAQIVRGERPRDFKERDEYIEWHRSLGIGFYLQGYFPFTQTVDNCDVRVWQDGRLRRRRIETPRGALSESWLWSEETFSEAPIERLVKAPSDLAAYVYMAENTRYEPAYTVAERRARQVGEMGIVLCYLPHTPLMQIVAVDAGIESLTMIDADAPDELRSAIEALEESLDPAVRIAVESPSEVLMIPENLSAEVVGPRFFELYVKECQTSWSRRTRESGKHSCVHMDGTLAGLLRQESSVGFSFIEAMTPQPVGDVSIHDWSSYRGDSRVVYWGGIPGSYFSPLVSDREFDRHVKEVLAVMREDGRMVLGVADQVPPDGLERRVARVAELAEVYGAY